MTAESGSSANPQVIALIVPAPLPGPIGIQVPKEVAKCRASSGRRDNSSTAPAERESARRPTPQPIRPTERRLRRRPNNPLIATPKSGRIGINQISFSIASSPLQEVDLVHVGRAPQAEQCDDDGEPGRRLGR